jgi:hypothetical protein
MKRRFATRKYSTNKFATNRFAGFYVIPLSEIYRIQYFLLHGPLFEPTFTLFGPSTQYFEQKIKDII